MHTVAKERRNVYSIAILDDDRACLNDILAMVKRWARDDSESWQIQPFLDEEQLFYDAKKSSFSLYLLDVVLSGTNGIAFAKRLRAADPDAVVIFISSSVEYAAASYDVKAFYYLLKPVSGEKLFSVLSDAAAAVKKRTASLFVKTADGTEHLHYDEICYAERYARRVRFVCKNRVVTGLQLTRSFRDEIAPLLSDGRFFPCGASLVVNLREVASIQQENVVLTTGETIYVPVKSKRALREAWADYWLNGGNIL